MSAFKRLDQTVALVGALVEVLEWDIGLKFWVVPLSGSSEPWVSPEWALSGPWVGPEWALSGPWVETLERCALWQSTDASSESNESNIVWSFHRLEFPTFFPTFFSLGLPLGAPIGTFIWARTGDPPCCATHWIHVLKVFTELPRHWFETVDDAYLCVILLRKLIKQH